MIVSETRYWVVCDECGYPYYESESPDEALVAARNETLADRHLHEIDGRHVCHRCTPEGKAETREHFVRLAQYAWKHDGVDPEVARAYAEELLDAGIFPPPETPTHLIPRS